MRQLIRKLFKNPKLKHVKLRYIAFTWETDTIGLWTVLSLTNFKKCEYFLMRYLCFFYQISNSPLSNTLRFFFLVYCLVASPFKCKAMCIIHNMIQFDQAEH